MVFKKPKENENEKENKIPEYGEVSYARPSFSPQGKFFIYEFNFQTE